LLRRLIVTCDQSEATEACLANIVQFYPEFDPVGGTIPIGVSGEQELQDAEVNGWLSDLPADVFVVSEITYEVKDGSTGEPTTYTVILGVVDMRRIYPFRSFVEELYHESLDTVIYASGDAAIVGTVTDEVSTESWILPTAPYDTLTANECADPTIHHGYLSAGANSGEWGGWDDTFLDASTVDPSPLIGFNDIADAYQPPRILFTDEHACSQSVPGTSELCDVLHGIWSSPEDSGLSPLWQGMDAGVDVYLYEDDLFDDEGEYVGEFAGLLEAIEALDPAIIDGINIHVQGELPLIGYRDGVESSIRRTGDDDVHDLVDHCVPAHGATWSLEVPIYVFPPDDDHLVVTVYDMEGAEEAVFKFKIRYPKSKWVAHVTPFVEPVYNDLEGDFFDNVSALPFDEALVVDPHLSSLQMDIWGSFFENQGALTTASDFEVLNGGSYDGEAFIADFNDSMDHQVHTIEYDEALTPLLADSLAPTVGYTLDEWSTAVGPYLGQWALDINNRIGREAQPDPGYPGWSETFGVVGFGVSEADEDWYDTSNCRSLSATNGIVVTMNGIDESWPALDQYTTQNKGNSWWATVDNDRLEASEGFQAFRDPHGQLYPAPPATFDINPIEAAHLDELFLSLLSNLEDVAVSDLHRDYCEARWFDRTIQQTPEAPADVDECGDLDDCYQFCVEHVSDAGYVMHWPECYNGCTAYYDAVESYWDQVCQLPDYLFVTEDEATGTILCAEYVDLELTDADVVVDLARDVTWHYENEPVPGGGFVQTCGCDLPDPVEAVTEPITYSPPAYVVQDEDGQVELRVPVPFEVVFTGAELDLSLNATLDACPDVPVPAHEYDEWADAQAQAQAAGDTDTALMYGARLITHVPIEPIVEDGEEVFDYLTAQPLLEDARTAFDAVEGSDHSEITLHIDITVDATLEYVFPVELERNWQWGLFFWQENAIPLPALWMDLYPQGRASTGMTMTIDDVSLDVDFDLSSFDSLLGCSADAVQNLMETHYDTFVGEVEDQIADVLDLAQGALPAVSMQYYRGDHLVNILREPLIDDENDPSGITNYDPAELQPDLARALVDWGDGNPNDPAEPMTSNNYPEAIVLPAPSMRSLLNWNDELGDCEPLDHYAYHMLFEVMPEELLIKPRWVAMDVLWRDVLCGQLPDTLECGYTMVATSHASLEAVDVPITRDIGTVIDEEELTYRSSTGLAAWLLFQPESDEPPADWLTDDVLIWDPSVYSEGYGAIPDYWDYDSWTSLELEDVQPLWAPGMP